MNCFTAPLDQYFQHMITFEAFIIQDSTKEYVRIIAK